MGFTGSYVVCRTGESIGELDAICQYDDLYSWTGRFQGDWQIGQWDGTTLVENFPGLLHDVATATGAPAIGGFISDNDYVHVVGFDSQRWWTACLARESTEAIMEEEGHSFELTYLSIEAATARAIVWANDAGLIPSPEAVEAVFSIDEPDPWAQDLFFNLLTALGLTRTDTS